MFDFKGKEDKRWFLYPFFFVNNLVNHQKFMLFENKLKFTRAEPVLPTASLSISISLLEAFTKELP